MPSFRESLTSMLTTWRIPFAGCTFGELLDGTHARAKTAPPRAVHAPATPPKAPAPSSRDRVLDQATQFLIKGEAVRENPYWPGGKSGVTLGVGWDASQQTRARLDSDWSELPQTDRDRLAATLGPANAGASAEKLAAGVKDITIPTKLALKVHRDKVVVRYYNNMLKTFPGADGLPDTAQVALTSLVFNRGGSLMTSSAHKQHKTLAEVDAEVAKTGKLDRYYEMRRIREDVAAKNIQGIANELRAMERVWAGTKIARGMRNRRESEAQEVEKSLPPSSSGKKPGPT